MLYICEIRENSIGVRDTDDSVIEYVTRERLHYITSVLGIEIKGVNKDNSLSVFKPKRQDYSEVYEYFFKLMRQEDCYSDNEVDEVNHVASVRNWGNWNLPDDYEDYEDDEDEIEDYDFEELDREWFKKLKEIRNKLSKRYEGLRFSIDTGEKNWIYLMISER